MRLTKNQRLLLQLTVVTLTASFGLFIILQTWLLGLVAFIVIDWFFFARAVTNKKLISLWPKLIRPVLALFLTMFWLSMTATNFGLDRSLLAALAFVAVFGHSFICWHELKTTKSRQIENIITISLIFLTTNIISLTLALNHWPLSVAMALSWVLNFLIVGYWLSDMSTKAEPIAAIWALVTVEFLLISSYWLVFYQLPVLKLMISQNSLIITGFAYGLGGIYYHQKRGTLTRSLVFEYFGVVTVIFAVLIVMTKWVNAL